MSYLVKFTFFYCICFFTLSITVSAQDTLLDPSDRAGDRIPIADSILSVSVDSSELRRMLNAEQIRESFDSLTMTVQKIEQSLNGSDTLTVSDLKGFQQDLMIGQEKVKLWHQALKSDQTPSDTAGFITDVTNLYFKLGAVAGEVDESIRRLENVSIKKKAGFIWSAPIRVNPNDVWGSLRNAFNTRASNLAPFTQSDWGGVLLLGLLTGAFFYWLYRNIAKLPERRSPPILESVLFFLVLLPLFDRSISSIYVSIGYLLVLLLLTWNFKAFLNINTPRWWSTFVVLYVLVVLINQMIMVNGFFIRLAALFLAVIGLIFGYYIFRYLKKAGFYTTLNRFIFSAYVLLLLLAIVSNVAGQINVSQLASITAFVSIAQLIGLVAFVKLVLEAVNVQFVVQRKRSKALIGSLNKGRILTLVKKALF